MGPQIVPTPRPSPDRQTLACAGLSPTEAASLDQDGYLLLRQAVAQTDLPELRMAFERGVKDAQSWLVPRGADWRHAQVDEHPLVQQACRNPTLLAGVWRLLKAPFFIAQVEGRDPCRSGGAQPLHRDGEADGSLASALLFLDPFGRHNGATRVVPGSHRRSDAARKPVTLQGSGGDILLFDPNLLHGATLNASGAARRSLLISYANQTRLAEQKSTAHLRNVRMPMDQVFHLADGAQELAVRQEPP